MFTLSKKTWFLLALIFSVCIVSFGIYKLKSFTVYAQDWEGRWVLSTQSEDRLLEIDNVSADHAELSVTHNGDTEIDGNLREIKVQGTHMTLTTYFDTGDINSVVVLVMARNKESIDVTEDTCLHVADIATPDGCEIPKYVGTYTRVR